MVGWALDSVTRSTEIRVVWSPCPDSNSQKVWWPGNGSRAAGSAFVFQVATRSTSVPPLSVQYAREAASAAPLDAEAAPGAAPLLVAPTPQPVTVDAATAIAQISRWPRIPRIVVPPEARDQRDPGAANALLDVEPPLGRRKQGVAEDDPAEDEARRQVRRRRRREGHRDEVEHQVEAAHDQQEQPGFRPGRPQRLDDPQPDPDHQAPQEHVPQAEVAERDRPDEIGHDAERLQQMDDGQEQRDTRQDGEDRCPEWSLGHGPSGLSPRRRRPALEPPDRSTG